MARPPSMWSRVHRFLKRRWSVISIAATVIVFSALFAVSLYIQSSKERSHWQLLYSERFSGRLGGGEWSEAPQSDTASWRISNGKLVARSKQRSFLRFARRFNRDILIEFDMGASEKDLYSAGFFLFGETPDSAYCFYIGRQGSGACGLTFPGSRFLFRTADQAKITIGPVNHVVIERIQNAITFQINGVVIARVWDYMPPLGRRHEQLGFFVEGCGVWFDNLKILRRAVPQKPSPTFVADRFWERGDFEAALEEYRSLQVDFGISERVKEIRLCIADCLARLGRYEQAMMTLREAADLQGRDESFESRKLFIEGIILNRLSSVCPSDSVFTVLAQRYPASTVNQSAMAFIIIRIASCIAASLLDSAEREIGLLSGNYDRYGDLWGELSMMVIERYAGRGLYDSAAAVAQRIIRRQERNCEVYTNAKEALGRIFLEKGNKNRAGDLFNQCIAAHLSSESVWEAWMGLASIYEHDFQHKEAATIYHKIYRECPSMFRARWMAALKLGELASRDSARHYASHFEAVVEGAHPFPLPRLIARFYLGEVNESQFKAEWDLHCPDDFMCLYYCARKAKFTREEVVARIYLQDCIDNLPPESWNYILANRAMNNFKKW
jgi:tetratricopeptide (TPR) repeat protein